MDLGRRTVLEPLFEALQPSTALICWIDHEPDPSATLPGAPAATVTSCAPDDLEAALGAGHGRDVIWLRGHPSWHAVRAITRCIAAHFGLLGVAPVVVVEGGPPNAAPVDQVESTKEGARLALAELGSQLDGDAVVLWCPTGRGVGAWIPRVTASSLEPWLDQSQELLEALRMEHLTRVELDARNLALFELLDQSQRDGTAVVRSFRFRLGTRVDSSRADGAAQGSRVPRPGRDPGAPGGGRPVAVAARDRNAGPTAALRVADALAGDVRVAGAAAQRRRARCHAARERAEAARRRCARRGAQGSPRPAPRGVPLAGAGGADACSRASERLMQGMHGDRHRRRDALDALPRGFARSSTRAARNTPRTSCRTTSRGSIPRRTRRGARRVKQTYGLIPHKIVTSEWLRDAARNETGTTSREDPARVGSRVLLPAARRSAGRDRSCWRWPGPALRAAAFDFVVATLAKVHEAMPDVEIVLFGEDIGSLELPFPYRGAGVITDHEQLARLYSRARVHFDGSDFQAFGLPALEAMACGAVSVITDVGGVREYARDERELPARPAAGRRCARPRAILRLLSDDALHRRLREGGLATSRSSFDEAAGAGRRSTFFEEIGRRQRGAP